ncbi:hypothetical protein ACFL0F_01650 [Patescibacteria group bacterium]
MRQKGAILIPVVVAVVLLVVLGYYFKQAFQYENNLSNNITPSPTQSTNTPKPTPVDYAASCDEGTIYVRMGGNREYTCVEKGKWENADDWNLFTSEHNYTIKHPDFGIRYQEHQDFGIGIYGEYPTGGCISVNILPNPDNIPLNELGNNKYAVDAPEPYDLNWKNTTIGGQKAIMTNYSGPGDSCYDTYYILEHKGEVLSILTGHGDEPGSNLYKDITEKILSTLKFI